MRRMIVALCLMLSACSSGKPVERPFVQPVTQPPATQAANNVPTATVGLPTLPAATEDIPTTPTLVEFRDARGVFTLLLPEQWNRRTLAEGIGVTATAYNATARYTLSLASFSESITPTLQAQIAEELKNGYFESYLVQEPDLKTIRHDDGTYVLFGTATLTGTPTTVEISLRQLPEGTLVSQVWLVPTELWSEFGPLFKEPIEQSLTIDESIMRSIQP